MDHEAEEYGTDAVHFASYHPELEDTICRFLFAARSSELGGQCLHIGSAGGVLQFQLRQKDHLI